MPNARLTKRKPGYSLERRQDGNMLIPAVDNDFGGEARRGARPCRWLVRLRLIGLQTPDP